MEPRIHADKRQSPRHPFQKLIEFQHHGYPDTQIHGKTKDISVHGVQIETAFPLNPGDGITLKLPLPGSKRGLGARVSWTSVNDQNHHFYAGCRFDEELKELPAT